MIVLVRAKVTEQPIQGGQVLEGLAVVIGKASVEGGSDIASRDGGGTKPSGSRELPDFCDLLKDSLEFRSEGRGFWGGIARTVAGGEGEDDGKAE